MFKNVFEAKGRPSCRSNSSGKLAVGHVLGILPSSILLMWPSQRSRLYLSKANMLGTPACARKSLFRMSKILLR